MSNNNYQENSIKVLKGLEAVRKRPGMYIGSTDERGLHHLIWEIFDNSIDEVLAGKANTITITLFKDNSIEIKDNGRGVPTGIHPDTGISTVETVFTVLHAGGKFDNSAYQSAGGLHGVGASVVNALSKSMTVTVYKQGDIWEAKFIDGGQISQKLTKIGKTNQTGTTVHFAPDPLIFKNCDFNPSVIEERVKESAFLFKNLKIIFNDIKRDTSVTFQSNDGIGEYVKFINDTKTTISSVARFGGIESEIEVDVAFQYTDSNSETLISFANSIKTTEGGTHLTGFKTAITECLNDFARQQQLLKEKEENFNGDDVREGLTAIVSVKVPEKLIQYEGQTKNKLFTPEARQAVEKVTFNKLAFWLQEHRNEGFEIIDKAKRAREAREAAKKAREEIKKLKGTKKERALSGKLTPAQSKDPKKKELFLVEGDSAGGSAKLGRSKEFQAILPLRGKVINVEKAKLLDLIDNEEISAMISTIGTGIGSEFNLEDLNYHKVIIMTDADTDGAHIQTLLLTFFYRYMRPLINNGNIYIALPPLYKVTKTPVNKNEFKYAWDENELEQVKKEYKNFEIQRYKGLGEMNADQLWETTMDPSTRQLIRVNIQDAVIAERMVALLMGDNAEQRKKWINDNVDFEVNG
jgi:topoisomerase-4 subunit B